MTQLVSVGLWLAALGHFILPIVSIQIPARLGWREELPKMEIRNRKLYLVATAYIVITYLGFGVLTVVLHDEMLRGDRSALALSVFIGIFWLVRVIVDFTWFGPSMYPKGRRFLIGHFVLTGLFICLTGTYLGLVGWHLLGATG